jgi:hypothetical protein
MQFYLYGRRYTVRCLRHQLVTGPVVKDRIHIRRKILQVSGVYNLVCKNDLAPRLDVCTLKSLNSYIDPLDIVFNRIFA